MTPPRAAADLTVAAVQRASVPGGVAANARSAADAVRDAAARGARLVVLPELYLCGYDLATLGVDPDGCDLHADRLEDEAQGRLAPLVDACARTGTLALVGASVRHGPGRRTIGLLAVGESGVRHVYDKLYLCGVEADHFVAGDRPVVLEVDGWPLGLAVCYDGCFPEHARAVADAGALVYVASTAYVAGAAHRRDLYYRARALENGMYAVVSGLVDACGDGEFGGGSAVLDPEGRVLAAVPEGAESLAVATLDRQVLEATRAAHRMHAEHRGALGPVCFVTPA